MGVTKPNETLKIRSTTGAGLFGQIYVEKVLRVLFGVASPRNENRIQPVQACAAVHGGMHLLTQCLRHLAALPVALHASAYTATSCPRYPVLSCFCFCFFLILYYQLNAKCLVISPAAGTHWSRYFLTLGFTCISLVLWWTQAGLFQLLPLLCVWKQNKADSTKCRFSK